MLGHNNLTKFKKTEILSSIFSDHDSIKLEINKRRKTHKYMKIKQHSCNNQWIKEEIKEGGSILRQKWKQHTKSSGMQ